MNIILSFSGVMNTILYIFLAIVILLLMVLIHELGHYTAGKLLKFKIEEFSVGFGKALLQKKKKNGELVSLRLIPLGGYCAFAGEGDTEDNKNPDAFNNQKPWKRLIVLFAGVFFNFLSAVIFSFVLLMAFGYEVPAINKIDATSINYGTTAEYIQPGDAIVKVNGLSIDFVKDRSFSSLIGNVIYAEGFDAGTDVINVTIKRNGKNKDIVLQTKDIEIDSENGVAITELLDLPDDSIAAYKASFGEACGQCWTFTFRWAWKIILILGDLFSGALPLNQLGGPVTTISTIATYTQTNFANLFVLLPLLAINLAVFNALPIPALDGAHMVFVLIEWIRRKPINREVENKIHNIGLMVLLGFVVLVDILHFLA